MVDQIYGLDMELIESQNSAELVREASTLADQKYGQDFNEKIFLPAFLDDLDRAKGLVRIQSPFLRLRRIETLISMIERTIRRGVRICVRTQTPELLLNNPTQGDEARFEEISNTFAAAVKLLKQLGVHVTSIPKIHGKFAIFDETIIWRGSLNILSHSNTSEEMTRWKNREMVKRMIEMHKLDFCEQCIQRQPAGDYAKAALKALGTELGDRSKLLGFTQRELAEAAKVARYSLGRLQSGDSSARLDTLIKISHTLDSEVRIIPRYLSSVIDRLLSE